MKTFIFMALLTHSAFASVGNQVKKLDVKEFSAVCRLTITDNYGNYGICTATVVSSNQLLTAEHCFHHSDLDRLVVVATCGNQELDSFISIQKFRKNAKDNSGYDLAIIKTSEPIQNIAPISITKFPEMYILKPTCRVLGFGKDEHGRTDDLRGFDLLNERLYLFKEAPQNIKMSSKLGPVLQNTVTEGDSGGPLLCRMTDNSPWELLGVNSNYHQVKGSKEIIANYFAPAFLINF